MEAKDAAKHPAARRTSPHNKELSSPNVRCALAEKLCFKEIRNITTRLIKIISVTTSCGVTKSYILNNYYGSKDDVFWWTMFCVMRLKKCLWWQQTFCCQQCMWRVPRKLFHKMCEWRKQYFFFFLIYLLFIFGCVGSSLMCTGSSLVVPSGGYSSLRCVGVSLRWLL